MYYCYSIKEGLFDGEMKMAKDLGVYLFYDEEDDLFIDQHDNIIDIKDMKIFPRTGVLQAPTLLNAIVKHQGIGIIDNKDYEKTLNWPRYIKTKRMNTIISGKEILANPDAIINQFGTDSVFFKTKDKNYSQVISVEKFLDKESPFYKALQTHQDDEFIISDVVEIIKEATCPLEYRAFIVEGEIFNISRVHDYLQGSIPHNILEKLISVIDQLKDTDFPKSYVMDLFVCKDKTNKTYIDVLECNPICSSGTYLYNSVLQKTDDLLHSCPSRAIPIEKIKYGPSSHYGFNVDGETIPSIYYELPGGFAADITSFAFFGTPSSKMSYIHIDTCSNIDPSSLFIGDMEIIESDSDFNNYSELGINTPTVENPKSVAEVIKQLKKIPFSGEKSKKNKQ